MHVSCCIRGGRIFLNRMLNVLRAASQMPQHELISLQEEFRKDVYFFRTFMYHFNGVSIMKELGWSTPDGIFASDASLTGLGGVNFQTAQYFSLCLDETRYLGMKIHNLEMLALICCCKLWGTEWSGKRLVAQCDNQCTVLAINTGRTKDVFMQACLRELFYWTSMYSFEIKCEYIKSQDNTLPDLLSRFQDKHARRAFFQHPLTGNLSRVPATNDLLNFTHNW